MFLAHEEAGGAALVAVDHGAGRRGMDAELVLERVRAQVVAFAERSVLVRQEFRHQEQRDAPVAGRRVGEPRQHEMHDVVGQIVLAVGDEDLLPGDPVGAIGALGPGAQERKVGAGLRLGELHGAHPFAGHELAQIAALEVAGAVHGERVDRGHGQHRADAEGHGSRVPHLDAGGVERVRQRLAAPFGGRGEAVPAGRRPGAIGLLPAGRRGHRAVLERRAVAVADGVQRRDDVGCEPAGLREHRVDDVFAEVAVEAGGERLRKACPVLERKGDVGDRRPIGHGATLKHFPAKWIPVRRKKCDH